MDARYLEPLAWIDTQQQRMIRLVSEWANINSGTENLDGLARMSAEVGRELQSLGAEVSHLDLPPWRMIDASGREIEQPLGQAVHARKRLDAPVRVFLGIHMDTV
ncbi:MAG TPA: hypothetical protein VG722_09025, partial [Tepidisphaeraceae bacterium]|nr:hypothetical protein [Tepidisphaeraceae bacterium]